MERTHSTPTTTKGKRKRDDSIAAQIVDNLEGRDTSEQGDDIQIWKEKLIKKAKVAIENPAIDQDDLKDRWGMLSKLLDLSAKAKSTAEEYASETETLRQNSETLKNFKFLTTVGDWAADVQSNIKKFDGRCANAISDAYKERLIASGMSEKDANDKKLACDAFRVIKGRDSTEAHDRLSQELAQIEEWRAGVRLEPPQTPHLDRLEYISNEAGTTRAFYLEVIRHSHERNVACHQPAPNIQEYVVKNLEHEEGSTDLEKNLKYKVDWRRVWDACITHKHAARALCRDGELNESQLDFFLRIIDTWFRLRVNGWKDGSDVPNKTELCEEEEDDAIEHCHPGESRGAKLKEAERLKEAAKLKDAERLKPSKKSKASKKSEGSKKSTAAETPKAELKMPDSPYKEGKWDDLMSWE